MAQVVRLYLYGVHAITGGSNVKIVKSKNIDNNY